MYLRNSPRYRRGHRGRSVIPWGRLLFIIILAGLIGVGIWIYDQRETLAPEVNRMVESVVGEAGERINEMNAPPPTPTPDPTADIGLADDMWARGAIQEAVNIYQRIAPNLPNEVGVHYRLALGLINQGRFAEALEAAENAITAQPYSSDAWAVRSMALNRMRRDREALASAMRAEELASEARIADNPRLAVSRARALTFMAEAYLNLGQVDRALTAVNQAIDLNPDSFEAYQVRGRINQEGLGNLAAALNDYREAYAIAPNMIYVAIWVARMERSQQNFDVALEIYQDIIDENPGNTPVLFEIGDYNFRVEGNYSQAASYFSRCVQSNPNNAACHYMLGRSQMSLAQPQDALASFETAMELNPGGEGGYYHYWLAQANISLSGCAQAEFYMQTGYQLALERNDQVLITSFESTLEECRVVIAPPVPGDEGDDETGEFDDAGSDV